MRIVIADDHPLLRRGLREVIESAVGFEVVGEAGDGTSALSCIQESLPDVAILDVKMPGLSGLNVAAAIRELNLPVEIVFLTVYRDESILHEALELGVKGYVLKECAAEDIVASVHAVAEGRFYASAALTTILVDRGRHREPAGDEADALASLTPTELRVLSLIADYLTSKEIAATLGVSPRTVETHRTNICQKTGIHGSHALIRYAHEHRDQLPRLPHKT